MAATPDTEAQLTRAQLTRAQLTRGLSLHRAGRLAEAAALYQEVLAAHPGHPAALHLLGLIAHALDRLEDAETLIRQSLAHHPAQAEAWSDLGVVLRGQSRTPEAIDAFERALAVAPDYAPAHDGLGLALKSQGRLEEAIRALSRAAALAPERADFPLHCGEALAAAGQKDEAAQAFSRVLALDPEDRHAAGAKLALLGLAATPPALPPAYVAALFDDYAPRFDAELQGRLGYRTPEILAAMVGRTGRQGLDVLDLGCGTGLMGRALKPLARRLDGIDLSPAMIARAQGLGVYDSLAVGEMTQALAAMNGAYDLLAAADVLNYVGRLEPVFAAAARALRPDGLFVLMVERAEDPGYHLHPGHRYRHHRDTVLAAAAGFTLLAESDAPARAERGVPVPTLNLLLAQRPAPPSPKRP